MMVVWRQTERWEHRRFRELPDILSARQFLVLNNTRVFPARLVGHRPGHSERIEVLLNRPERKGEWLALIRPGRKALPGQTLQISHLRAEVIELREAGQRLLCFDPAENLMEEIEQIGLPPLPPYIRRASGRQHSEDRERYQTVFAKTAGSVAAPTAGLHFTPEILALLDQRGIERCEILLHVGYGTFQPVRSSVIQEHRLDPEYYQIPQRVAARIHRLKQEGKELVAVGTTTTRALEYQAKLSAPEISGGSGLCDLFIYPGFQFRLLDGLLTNFHLPRSTLLMLVCAFAGRELILRCYHEAVRQRYRFYSYGDCMLIL